jgi:hypothetical protein
MKVRINTREFKRFVASYKRKLDRAIPKALNRSGEKAVETIVDRTSRGVGLLGGFKRYSSEYADYRREKGRGTKPDLNFSGRMLSNLGVERVNNTKVKVAFSRKEEETKARNVGKKRPFIGARPQEVKFIADAFRRQLERDIK